jgi:heme-degrading monooxygenase HmoA
MIAVFVTFSYANDFNAAKLAQIAEGARGKFEGMPGLRSKLFSVRPELRQATNVYIWESEEQARAFFSDQLLGRVTSLYGIRPTIEFASVAALVDNRPTG